HWNLQCGKFESHPALAPALRLDDGGELVHGLLHVTIDDQIVVLPPGRDLLARPGKTAGGPDRGVGELVHSLLHVTIDDQIVVLPPGRDLLARPGKPAGDLDRRVAVALPEPRLEVLSGRRPDEDR